MYVLMFVHLFTCASWQPCCVCWGVSDFCTCESSELSCMPLSLTLTHSRAVEALLRVSVNFICLHVRAISPAIHARLYSPALRRLQSRGVRACFTYIRCYMFITWIMHVVPWQFFDAKSIVDHSVYSMHRKAATIYHGNASRYMGTATNTPPHLLHTHVHCTDKAPTLILQ